MKPIIISALTLLSLIFLFPEVVLLTVVLTILSVIAVGLPCPDKKRLALYGTGFFIGPLVDLAAIHYGVWSYSVPTMYGIPLWLPFAFGIMVLMMKDLSELISG